MAEAGHNSRELTENEDKALFMDCVRKDIEHLAIIKAAQDARKKDRKIFQSYDYELSSIDYAVKAMSAEDKGPVIDRSSNQNKILFWLGLIPGYQPDLFVDRAAGLERIESEGERAGWQATERVSPYAKGSDEDAAWHRGYDKSQKLRADNLLKAMEKKNVELAVDAGEPNFPDGE